MYVQYKNIVKYTFHKISNQQTSNQQANTGVFATRHKVSGTRGKKYYQTLQLQTKQS